MSGAILTLPSTQAPPSGFVLGGTSDIIYLDAAHHLKTLAVKYWQRP